MEGIVTIAGVDSIVPTALCEAQACQRSTANWYDLKSYPALNRRQPMTVTIITV
ncbi:MAG: hypothetical protein Kow0074_12830 [Candidatus Zixiibacteriota bacterium]